MMAKIFTPEVVKDPCHHLHHHRPSLLLPPSQLLEMTSCSKTSLTPLISSPERRWFAGYAPIRTMDYQTTKPSPD
jgi:hypothetical protein